MASLGLISKTQKNKRVRRSQRDYTLAIKLAVVDEVESCRLLGRSRQGIYQHIARRKMKMEYLLYKPSSLTELECMIRQSVQIYNELGPHTSLNLQTPESVHRKAGSEELAGQ